VALGSRSAVDQRPQRGLAGDAGQRGHRGDALALGVAVAQGRGELRDAVGLVGAGRGGLAQRRRGGDQRAQRSQPVAARFTTSLREAPHGMFAIRPGADRHVNLFRGADVLTFANASAPGDRQCKVEW
jgi:hypothetical protein